MNPQACVSFSLADMTPAPLLLAFPASGLSSRAYGQFTKAAFFLFLAKTCSHTVENHRAAAQMMLSGRSEKRGMARPMISGKERIVLECVSGKRLRRPLQSSSVNSWHNESSVPPTEFLRPAPTA